MSTLPPLGWPGTMAKWAPSIDLLVSFHRRPPIRVAFRDPTRFYWRLERYNRDGTAWWIPGFTKKELESAVELDEILLTR